MAKKKPAAKKPAKPEPNAMAALGSIMGTAPAKPKPAARAPAAPRAKVKATTILAEFPVKFGNVSIGKRTGKVGFSLPREFCTLARADELFVDRRLRARVILGRSADANGQTSFIEPDLTIVGDFDVKGFRVGSDSFSGLGLTFMLKEIDLEEVSHLSGGSGRIVVNGVGEIPADAPADEDFEDGPGLFEGPWEEIAIEEAFPKITPAILKSVKANGITTVGKLAEWTAKHGERWTSALGGVGPVGREKLEKMNEEFWAANPQYSTP
jgi:hypothetical protein